MDELKALKQRLETERPEKWEGFPDINLYKDQVVGYLKRQLIDPTGDGLLTPAMISNYVKDKLLPKADGKKYNRKHLALLTEISLLKQVLPVKDMGIILKEEDREKRPDEFYGNFTNILDHALSETAAKMNPDIEKEDIHNLALKFAIESYCAKLACESLIVLIREKDTGSSSHKKD